ncbi:MAG: hypothetical protein U9P07_02960 [Pseudomonadota bacterium]|nr:hypothetical protein [Pseudomonadota bacterium]
MCCLWLGVHIKKLIPYRPLKSKFLSPTSPTYHLPKSMYEALVMAEKSKFLKSFLGSPLYEHYMNLKTEEWEGYRTFVTTREHRKNLST